MSKYITPMNEAYMKKNYPNGFMAGAHKNTRAAGMVLCGIAVFLLIVFIPVILFVIWFAVQNLLSGGVLSTEEVVLLIIGLVFVIPAIFIFKFGRKCMKKDPGKLLEEWAKQSNYPTDVIQEYIDQVLLPDTYILKIAGKSEGLIGTGFLTRDFLALNGLIMKRSDIAAACLVNIPDTISAGNKIKTVYRLKVVFLSPRRSLSDYINKEAVNELIDLLISRHPDIDTRLEPIMSEKELNGYCRERFPGLIH